MGARAREFKYTGVYKNAFAFAPFFSQRTGLMRAALYIRDRSGDIFHFLELFVCTSGIWSEMTHIQHSHQNRGRNFSLWVLRAARERRAVRLGMDDGCKQRSELQ